MLANSEQPFRLAVPDEDLDLLQRKLALVSLPDELEGAGWDYGVPLADIKRLVERWKNGFDWRVSEAAINRFPQFTRDIEVDGFGSLNVHYVHQRSEKEDAIPLLFVHGWPGHFMEVSKLLPLLTAVVSNQPSFHVVALSLPAFGFSEAPKKGGFALTQHAEVAHKLMLALGYEEYVTQGGDWGHMITSKMAHRYGGKHVKAWHTNFPISGPPPVYWPRHFLVSLVATFLPHNVAALAATQKFRKKGRGYFEIQATRPQTLGYSLADSPVGLLAWIYDKLVSWTDAYPWTDDEVLTWVSIYWFSRTGPAASVRIYYEATNANEMSERTWSSIPLGLSFFPKELITVPRAWARSLGNVVFESEHASGGHFAAFEKPEELASDLRKMFGKGGGASAKL